jgi:hypothetical protein
MNRKLLIPALLSLSVAMSVSSASAGVMVDFIPRMDFKEQNELVTKNDSNALKLCISAGTEKNACVVELQPVAPNPSKNADK